MIVYYWPDGTWCEKYDLDEYLSWKSDDFGEIIIDNNMSDEDIDRLIAELTSKLRWYDVN